MSETSKNNFLALAEKFGYYSDDKIQMLANIISKVIRILFAVIFFVLRGKAKLAGKKGRSRVFLVLGVFCIINALIIKSSGTVGILATKETPNNSNVSDNDFEIEADDEL